MPPVTPSAIRAMRYSRRLDACCDFPFLTSFCASRASLSLPSVRRAAAQQLLARAGDDHEFER